MEREDVMKALASLGLFAAIVWLIIWLIKKD